MKSTVLSRIAEGRGKISSFAAKTTWGARILSVVAAMCGGLLTATPAFAFGAVYEVPITISVFSEDRILTEGNAGDEENAGDTVPSMVSYALIGTFRDAVIGLDSESEVDAIVAAAIAECERHAAALSSPVLDALLGGLRTTPPRETGGGGNGIPRRESVTSVTVNFDAAGCRVRVADADGSTTFADAGFTVAADDDTEYVAVDGFTADEFAAFVPGHDLILGLDQGGVIVNGVRVNRGGVIEIFFDIASSRGAAENAAEQMCVDAPNLARLSFCRSELAVSYPIIPSVSGGGGSSSSSSNTAAYILGGAVAVAIAAYFLSDGDLSWFSATPDFGYSITESGYAYNYGGRVDFRKDRWHLYWTAGGASADGDFGGFGYASGGEYKTDLWSAAFSEQVSGETADYDLSLSAKYESGIWTLSPAYRLHSRFEREQNGWESETENSLNLEGALRADRWTVRSAAGFQWREAEDFGDNAQLKISAVRNL